MSKSPVTCHGKIVAQHTEPDADGSTVLDSSLGRPAAGVAVELQEVTLDAPGDARFDTLAKG